MVRIFLFFVGMMILCAGQAQNKVLVTKNFRFEDGIYLDFSSLKANKPAYKFDEVDMVHFVNPQTHLAQVQYILVKEGNLELHPDSVWAVCFDGLPYKRIDKDSTGNPLPTFVGLKARGKLSYFSYTKTMLEEVSIKAYNPINGRPFRVGTVSKPNEIKVEKMLHWETGEEKTFNRVNLLAWLEDDTAMKNTVEDLKEDEVEQKLFRCLLIYDDRNPVYLEQ
ncbi:MAG: hypothetical protein R2879_18400 [Saprospiraceae bacterium]